MLGTAQEADTAQLPASTRPVAAVVSGVGWFWRRHCAEGMVVTQGGLVGGYGLYLREGKPTFVYNYLALDRPTFAATEPLPKGKARLNAWDLAAHRAESFERFLAALRG